MKTRETIDCTPLAPKPKAAKKPLTEAGVRNQIANMRRAMGSPEHTWGAAAVERLQQNAAKFGIQLNFDVPSVVDVVDDPTSD